MKPRLLDLFCGAGGAAAGYHRAGFEVIGVDINPQPNYPFEFVLADALGVFDRDYLLPGGLDSFVAIHASPPCQDYSKALRHLSNPTPRLIEPVRDLLEASGLPWVIENVEGAPLPSQHTICGRYGSLFCGSYFGLRVQRHRLFEANWPIRGTMCRHSRSPLNPYNKKGREAINLEFPNKDGLTDWPERVWRKEMGIEWMDRYEGREAIPPRFTEEIGFQLMVEIGRPRMAPCSDPRCACPTGRECDVA